MTNSLLSLANTDNYLLFLAKQLGFGFLIMSIVFMYLGFFLTRISATHAIKSRIFTESSEYWGAVYEFIYKMTLLALVQIGAIAIWGAALLLTGLIDNPTMSFLFAGSCYTTIGIFSDLLPNDWKSLALIIAFSGLFSFAWSTSIMMNMTSIFQEAWNNKNEKVLRDFYLRHKKNANIGSIADWSSTYELVISAPLSKVWAALKDVKEWSKWNIGISAITLNGEFTDGTNFNMTLPEGDQVTSTIKNVVENNSFTIQSKINDNVCDVIHTITDIGNNFTKVTYTVNANGPQAKEVGLGICADFNEVLHGLNKYLSITKIS